MNIVKTVAEVRAERWRDPALTWGLVPTMGALHEGHLALARRAKAENHRVAVSIFVNPAQFNNPDDLKKYPRTVERDLDLLRRAGVDLAWTPTVEEVYPPDFQTAVNVEEVTQVLEGAARPGHFTGVATVVAKLFNVFQPARAYFGQKDAQQVVVIQQMARDLNFNLEIVTVPTVRETDGLAMSSRNARLNPMQRQAAAVLYRALMAADQAWRRGERDAGKLRLMMTEVLNGEPQARLEYVSAADPLTLQEVKGKASRLLLSMAVFIGEVRLIDNIIVVDVSTK